MNSLLASGKSGFTLIEMLVALFIFGLSLSVIVTGLQSGDKGLQEAAFQSEALSISRSLIVAQQTAASMRLGSTNGSSADGYQWHVSVTRWSRQDPESAKTMGAYKIDLEISKGVRAIRLSTISAGPAIDGN